MVGEGWDGEGACWVRNHAVQAGWQRYWGPSSHLSIRSDVPNLHTPRGVNQSEHAEVGGAPAFHGEGVANACPRDSPRCPPLPPPPLPPHPSYPPLSPCMRVRLPTHTQPNVFLPPPHCPHVRRCTRPHAHTPLHVQDAVDARGQGHEGRGRRAGAPQLCGPVHTPSQQQGQLRVVLNARHGTCTQKPHTSTSHTNAHRHMV
jgi:hypothetical protein